MPSSGVNYMLVLHPIENAVQKTVQLSFRVRSSPTAFAIECQISAPAPSFGVRVRDIARGTS